MTADRRRRLLLAVGLSVLTSLAATEPAPKPGAPGAVAARNDRPAETTSPAGPPQEVVELSPFVVNTDIIPVRIATADAAPDGFIVPGGRGIGYSRYDLVTPREWRFTTTWSY